MEIKLESLELWNFKGIKHFKFTPAGKNASILGRNASGKTTVADAFRWLFFGKDTNDRADFGIKTVNPLTGYAATNLDHTVQAMVEIDGVTLDLKKTYKEKWTRKRGAAKKSLTSHTTNHFISGVPITKGKWDGRLKDIIDEDVFKLVTLPTFFNGMPWQRRRAILLDVCGDISDGDVIASDESLMALPGILGDRTLQDQKDVISAAKTKINNRLKEIPARIDELIKTLPEKKLNRKAVEAYIGLIDTKIQKARDDTELAGLRKELAEKQAELAEAQTKQGKDVQKVNQAIDTEVFKAQAEIRTLQTQSDDIQARIDGGQNRIQRNEKTMTHLRTNFATVAARKQAYGEICPTCNQPLPQDQIEAAKARFNENQSSELKVFQVDGKRLKAENEKLQAEITAGERKIEALGITVKGYEKEIEIAEKGRVMEKTDENIFKLNNCIGLLEIKIKDHKTTDTTALEQERREEQTKLAAMDAAQHTLARIDELGKEEKKLISEYEMMEGQLWLIEKFIVSKCNLLEDKINQKFELVEWRLFETQVNEGIKECCIVILNGSTDLSSSEKINVGLDIINTLSGFYNVHAPIWIDNAETVTETLEIPAQTIKLVVSPDHPEMEVSY